MYILHELAGVRGEGSQTTSQSCSNCSISWTALSPITSYLHGCNPLNDVSSLPFWLVTNPHGCVATATANTWPWQKQVSVRLFPAKMQFAWTWTSFHGFWDKMFLCAKFWRRQNKWLSQLNCLVLVFLAKTYWARISDRYFGHVESDNDAFLVYLHCNCWAVAVFVLPVWKNDKQHVCQIN